VAEGHCDGPLAHKVNQGKKQACLGQDGRVEDGVRGKVYKRGRKKRLNRRGDKEKPT